MSSNKDFYYDTYGRVQRRSPASGDLHSGSSLTAQGRRIILPPLTEAFPTSHSPVSGTYAAHYQPSRPNQASYDASSYGHYNYPAAPVPQQASQGYPSYQQQAEPRYGSPQYPSYPSRTSPPVASDPRRLPPLNVPQQQPARDERWQGGSGGVPYYPQSQIDTQMISTTSDVRSPHATYPTGYPQHYQSMSVNQYPTSHTPSRGVGHVAPAVNQHYQQQQPMPMGHASVERSMPIRTGAQLPYARAAPVMSSPVEESPLDANEAMIKKKRKRADARQLEALNNTFARTAFPSTEERAALAKDLDMSARSVQIWFQNKRQSMKQGGRQTGPSGVNTSSGQQAVPTIPVPVPSPSVSGYRSTPPLINPTSTTGPSGSSYSSSRSPPPYISRTGQSASPPDARSRVEVDPRRQWHGPRAY